MEKFFSLGLHYNEILDLTENQLSKFLELSSREEIVDWLQWNDSNGVYSDRQSLIEFGSVLTKKEGINIIKRQILET